MIRDSAVTIAFILFPETFPRNGFRFLREQKPILSFAIVRVMSVVLPKYGFSMLY